MQEMSELLLVIQKLAYIIIRAAHEQNYDKEMRGLVAMSARLRDLIKMIEKSSGIIDADYAVNSIMQAIVEINDAQTAGDNILIADLVELQLLPLIMEIVAVCRENMDMSVCEENFAYNLVKLGERYPDLKPLAEAAKEQWLVDDNPKYWLEMTTSGAFTLASSDKRGTYYYHSNNNPYNEAYDFANYYYNQDYDRFIVYGMGLGYHVREILEIDESVEMTIFDNDIQILMHAMMANRLDWLWDDKRITLIIDPSFSSLSKQLKQNYEEICVITHSPSIRHVANKKIEEKLNQLFVIDSSHKNQVRLLNRNFRENIKTVKKSVDLLKDEFSGKNVIIVAAGPSLDKNIDLLKNVKKDVLIIATGTVFRKLVNMGIKVDYVMIADANKRVVNQINGLEDEEVPMILLSTSYQEFAKKYEGEKYLVYQKDYDFSEIVAEQMGYKLYETGGSVSTFALDVCLKFGCKNIAFIGLDLAYTDNLAHASGTSRRAANDIDDLPRVKGYRLRYISDNKMVDGEIVAGEYKIEYDTVISSHLFDIYRNWIVKRLGRSDYISKVYNATEGGSYIDNMKCISLAEYLSQIE